VKVFISDIHLGDGSKADDFHRDKELISFLQWTDNRAGEIVIVGDLYELWQADLEDIFWAHPEVINALAKRNNKITYLYGNHDYLPFSKLTPEVYENGNITAMHGHQFDEHNNFKNPLFNLRWPVGKYITLLVAELERWVSKDADVWLDKQRKRFGEFMVNASLLQNKKSPRDYTGIVDVLSNRRLDKISIFGHNHRADVVLKNIKTESLKCCPVPVEWPEVTEIYANCGTWVDGTEPTFIAVDGSKVQLRNGLDYSIIKEMGL